MTTEDTRISMIAALSRDTRAIGRDNKLLWRLPEDMARFTSLTSGHPVIMGRKTWESIPAKFRPLPGRTNVVVTRDEGYAAEGGVVVHSLEDAITAANSASGADEIFIMGGGELYKEALPLANRLYLTIVDSNEDGDAYFPEYADAFTKILLNESHDHDGLLYSFVTLERD
ncbi:MAG: dhfrIII [Parcubacteria group bacterium]|nr:dhfrIII [Parcubacteria group bacterium]